MYVEIPHINHWARDKGIRDILQALVPAQERSRIVFRFGSCFFISAEAMAILAGTKLLRDTEGFSTDIDMDTLDHKVERFLGNSRFLDLFGHKQHYARGANSLPIYGQPALSKEGILDYIDQEIMRRSEMPEMSEALQKEIRRAFFELFGNIFHHSRSPIGGLVCGQVYPNIREIQVVFYDVGVGLAKRVRSVESSIRSDNEAIEWALKRGTSTLANSSEARGLGLFLLYQFLRVNEGEFRIYANQGIIEQISDFRRFGNLPCTLNGTLVDLRIKVRNDVKYVLSSEDEE